MLNRFLYLVFFTCISLLSNAQIKAYKDSVITLDFVSLQAVAPTNIIAVAGEDEYIPVALPFTFTFFEQDYDIVNVGINGLLTFGQTYEQNDFNTDKLCYPIPAGTPTPTNPDNFIAAYWDDLSLDPSCDGGAAEQAQIAYEVTGVAGNQVLTISWEYLVRSADGFPCTTLLDPSYGGFIKSQVKLFEGSNAIEIHLGTNNATAQGATIGVENIDGTYANYVNCGVSSDPGSNIAWLFTPTTTELPGNTKPPGSGFCNSNGIDCISGAGDDYQIINVTLANLDNSSSCDSGYTDYTNLSATLKEGGSYNLRVRTAAFGNPVVSAIAWIDWNNDTVFDASEQIDLVGTDSGNLDFEGDFNGTVTVPDSVVASTVRMRVISKSITDDNDPCRVDTQGETEDYHIKISDLPSEYCEATGWDCNTAVDPDWIDEIVVDTDNGILTNNSGCNGGYADFSKDTAKYIDWSTGNPYLLSVDRELGYVLGFVDVWVDWNEDGNFSVDERTTTPYQGSSIWEVPMIASTTASSGLKKMRIRGYIFINGSEGNPSSPCGFRANGEVEDYTIRFTSTNDAGFLACTNLITPANDEVICSDKTEFSWSAVTDATNYKFTVIDTITKQIIEETFTTETSLDRTYTGSSYAWTVIAYNDAQRASNCDTSYFRVVATGNPEIDLSAYTSGINLCLNSDTIISPLVNNGVGPYTFSWSNTGTIYLNSTIDSLVTFTASVVGSFRLNLAVTDQNGCAASPDSIDITVVNAGEAGKLTIIEDTICSGASFVVAVTGNNIDVLVQESLDKISWTDIASTPDNLTISPISTGMYYYRAIADLNSCSDTSFTDSVFVKSLPTKPFISPGADLSFCIGDSATFTTLNYTSGLEWMPSGTIASSYKTYSKGLNWVVYTDAFGCKSVSDTVEVTLNSIPVAPIINGSEGFVICSSDSTILSTQTYNSYLWSTGETSSSIIVKVAGTYNVVVENTSGCTSKSADVIVTTGANPTKPTISSSLGDRFCEGETTELSTEVNNIYAWSTSESTQNIMVNTAGAYTVTVTNADGCSSTSDVFNIAIDPKPVKPTLVVQNDTTVVCLESAAVYMWYLDGVLILTSPDSVLNVSQNGKYTVIISSNSMCLSDESDFVIVNKVAIQAHYLENEVIVYPNPTSGVINIQGNWDRFELFSLEGKLVGESNNKAKTLRLPVELNGRYILKIYQDETIYIKHLEVVK